MEAVPTTAFARKTARKENTERTRTLFAELAPPEGTAMKQDWLFRLILVATMFFAQHVLSTPTPTLLERKLA